MKKYLLLQLAIFTCISCDVAMAPAKYGQNQLTPIDNTQNKEVGETLIEHTEGFFNEAIIITKGSTAESPTISKEIKEGEVYVNIDRVNNNYNYYNENNKSIGIKINKKNNKQKLLLNDGLGWLTHTLKNKVEYTLTTRPDFTKKFYKREFIYNGKSGNAIKFTYREFVDNTARPSFTQETQYDLNESNTIGFQGMRIEILKATNTSITYKILKGFN